MCTSRFRNVCTLYMCIFLIYITPPSPLSLLPPSPYPPPPSPPPSLPPSPPPSLPPSPPLSPQNGSQLYSVGPLQGDPTQQWLQRRSTESFIARMEQRRKTWSERNLADQEPHPKQPRITSGGTCTCITLPVTPAQLMRPGIGRNASCALDDCLTSRP